MGIAPAHSKAAALEGGSRAAPSPLVPPHPPRTQNRPGGVPAPQLTPPSSPLPTASSEVRRCPRAPSRCRFGPGSGAASPCPGRYLHPPRPARNFGRGRTAPEPGRARDASSQPRMAGGGTAGAAPPVPNTPPRGTPARTHTDTATPDTFLGQTPTRAFKSFITTVQKFSVNDWLKRTDVGWGSGYRDHPEHRSKEHRDCPVNAEGGTGTAAWPRRCPLQGAALWSTRKPQPSQSRCTGARALPTAKG